MKSLQYISIALIFLSLFSCSSAKIFIVRHAEKSIVSKTDPPLTPEGEKRAMDLARAL
jgi:hypothetical protein